MFTTKLIVISAIQIVFIFFGECEMALQHPKTSVELQTALNEATAGDVITLLPEEYVGSFNISRSGSKGNLISIVGTSVYEDGVFKNTLVTNNGSGVLFDVIGNFVKIGGMQIANGTVAIQMNGSDNLITSVSIYEVEQAVIMNGDNNRLKASHIENLGNVSVQIIGNQNILSSSSIYAHQKAVIMSGNETTVRSSSIKSNSDTALTIETGNDIEIDANTLTSLTILRESSGGIISGCTIRGLLNIHGSGYYITAISTRGDVNIQGCDNLIESSSFKGNVNISSCNGFDSMSNSFNHYKQIVA